jgi:hypothetical protein
MTRDTAPELAMFFEDVAAGAAVFYGLRMIASSPGFEGGNLRLTLQHWRVDAEPLVWLSRELERRSPVLVNNVSYTVTLVDISRVAHSDRVDVLMTAKSQRHQHTGTLQVDPASLTQRDFPDRALRLIERIVRGELLPGTRELL